MQNVASQGSVSNFQSYLMTQNYEAGSAVKAVHASMTNPGSQATTSTGSSDNANQKKALMRPQSSGSVTAV